MKRAVSRLEVLRQVHVALSSCRACPKMKGPAVHGPPILGPVMLVGQAPGPREGSLGRPFAWTAGRTLFRWFEETMGVSEERFRACVYMAAVARCFPGKAKGGGDRKPDTEEIGLCGSFLRREVEILRPELVLAVGSLAIGEVLGQRAAKKKLSELVGECVRASWFGHDTDVIALPHPSGASPWHKIEPGKTLLARALAECARHPAMRMAFSSAAPEPARARTRESLESRSRSSGGGARDA